MATEKSVAAATLVYVQAGLAALTGFGLLALADRRRRSVARPAIDGHVVGHPGLWALVLFAGAGALVVVALGIRGHRPGAKAGAYVVEVLVASASLLAFRPARALVGSALAVAVVVLVARDRVGASAADGSAATS